MVNPSMLLNQIFGKDINKFLYEVEVFTNEREDFKQRANQKIGKVAPLWSIVVFDPAMH